MELKGYLYKRGNGIQTWKKRYFVLKSNKLSYFIDIHQIDKKGEIVLNFQSAVERWPDAARFKIN